MAYRTSSAKLYLLTLGYASLIFQPVDVFAQCSPSSSSAVVCSGVQGVPFSAASGITSITVEEGAEVLGTLESSNTPFVTFLNNGQISVENMDALLFRNSGHSIINDTAGSIVAVNGAAIFLDQGASVTGGVIIQNNGLLSSNAQAILSSGIGVSLSNYGVIEGDVALGNGDDDVENFGTINGSVLLGNGTDRLILRNDLVSGNIDGGSDSSSDTLQLEAEEGQEFTLPASRIANFEQLFKGGAGSWNLNVDTPLSLEELVVNNGRLVLNGTDTLTIANSSDGVTVGFGSALYVNNTLSIDSAGNQFSVDGGSVLGGTGTIILSGSGMPMTVSGTLSPGSPTAGSIGTLAVLGNTVSFESGSTLQIDLGSGGARDLFQVVGGDIQIQEGANVSFAPALGASGTYTFLMAENGISGTAGNFANAANGQTIESGLWRYRVNYDNAQGTVGVTVTSSPGDGGNPGGGGTVTPGLSGNQARLERVFAAGATSSSDLNAVAGQVTSIADPEQRKAAYDSLTGEITTAMPTASMQADTAFRQILSGRVASWQGGMTVADAGRLSVNDRQLAYLGDIASLHSVRNDNSPAAPHGAWARALGHLSNVSGNADVSGYDYGLGGVITGYDKAVSEDMRAGLALGFTRTDVDFDTGDSDAQVSSYHMGIYGSYDADPVIWSAALTYNYHAMDLKRTLITGPSTTRQASGQAHANEVMAHLGVERVLPFGQMNIRPFAFLDYIYSLQDGFTETGAGDVGLVVDDENSHTLTGTLGGAVNWHLKREDSVIVPELHLAVSQDMIRSNDASSHVRFIGGGPGFEVDGVDVGRTALLVGAAVTAQLEDSWQLFGTYDASIRRSEVGHTVTFGARLEW